MQLGWLIGGPVVDDRMGLLPGDALDATGPSVVTINGVVASLAATEAMVYLTGLRPPAKQLT
jgi:hypothetical protein